MEFVNAYRANRLGLMAGAADASAIGRAIKAFMAKHADGFEGKMEDLLVKLGTYRRGAGDRDWPKDATRLAGFIRRVVRPLDAAGIEVRTGVDLRPLTQKGITIHWKSGLSL